MYIFIASTVILIASIFLIVYDYGSVKNTSIDLEVRIKRYIFGGIELLGIGALLVALPIIGSRDMDIEIGNAFLIIAIVLAVLVYTVILYLWHIMFGAINKQISKKTINNFKYKFKSISIYGLVYSFGILFYIIYAIVLFK